MGTAPGACARAGPLCTLRVPRTVRPVTPEARDRFSFACQLLGTLDLDHVLPPRLFDMLSEAIATAIRAAVTQERERWVADLDAALRDEPDTSRSDINVHWRARIRAIVGARIEAAVIKEREACLAEVRNADHEGLCEGVCGENIAKAISARGRAS